MYVRARVPDMPTNEICPQMGRHVRFCSREFVRHESLRVFAGYTRVFAGYTRVCVCVCVFVCVCVCVCGIYPPHPIERG